MLNLKILYHEMAGRAIVFRYGKLVPLQSNFDRRFSCAKLWRKQQEERYG